MIFFIWGWDDTLSKGGCRCAIRKICYTFKWRDANLKAFYILTNYFNRLHHSSNERPLITWAGTVDNQPIIKVIIVIMIIVMIIVNITTKSHHHCCRWSGQHQGHVSSSFSTQPTGAYNFPMALFLWSYSLLNRIVFWNLAKLRRWPTELN